MEIREMSWNFFHVPIEPRCEEDEQDYLKRVGDCLSSFYEGHTSLDECDRDLCNPFIGKSLESLKLEHNFCSMNLEGINYCDVKFFVGTPSDNYGRVGIDILSHGDDKERRRPMVDHLREKWGQFDYTFED
jgi:hypothetical protein